MLITSDDIEETAVQIGIMAEVVREIVEILVEVCSEKDLEVEPGV